MPTMLSHKASIAVCPSTQSARCLQEQQLRNLVQGTFWVFTVFYTMLIIKVMKRGHGYTVKMVHGFTVVIDNEEVAASHFVFLLVIIIINILIIIPPVYST